MTQSIAPIFDDGESQLFEVKRGLAFPILAPDAATRARLSATNVEPYGRAPWVTNTDVKVQISWTLSNLDDEGHAVEVLIDPWNEFGRYWPGLQVTNAEEGKFQPNRSGIDEFLPLEGKGSGDASRRHGTFTFDEMNEVAIDFATVLNMIKNPPGTTAGQPPPQMMADLLPTYTNHAFNAENISNTDLLVKQYVPAVVPGLTGVDFGLRTFEHATIALEITVEVVDLVGGRVQEQGKNAALLEPPTEIITTGTAGP
jgi:hypothetical protein